MCEPGHYSIQSHYLSIQLLIVKKIPDNCYSNHIYFYVSFQAKDTVLNPGCALMYWPRLFSMVPVYNRVVICPRKLPASCMLSSISALNRAMLYCILSWRYKLSIDIKNLYMNPTHWLTDTSSSFYCYNTVNTQLEMFDVLLTIHICVFDSCCNTSNINRSELYLNVLISYV